MSLRAHTSTVRACRLPRYVARLLDSAARGQGVKTSVLLRNVVMTYLATGAVPVGLPPIIEQRELQEQYGKWFDEFTVPKGIKGE